MPIAFPPQDRGPDWNWPDAISQKLIDSELQIDVTNLGGIGLPFGSDYLNPGFGRYFGGNSGVNLRNLGFDYENVQDASRINPAQQYNQRTNVDNGVTYFQTDWAQSNRAITGVSRDSSNAPLGLCDVDLFATGSDQLIFSTTSDASGNFSFGNPGTGPFYIVAYKVGSPDVAGTTVNTLLPSAV